MSYLYHCQICDVLGDWRAMRVGDVITAWACHGHLVEVCQLLQRPGEITELAVTDATKAREWAEIRRSLDAVAGSG